MTLPHIVYIPLVLGSGFMVGWYLGARTVRGEWERADKRAKARDKED